MRFSQRHGYRPAKGALRREDVDPETRAGLWDVLELCFWHRADDFRSKLTQLDRLSRLIWHGYFKEPTDTIPDWGPEVVRVIRRYFFTCEWYEVCDFIEFLDQHGEAGAEFANLVNTILEREVSAYRLIGGRIVEITSTAEIAEIEEALGDTEGAAGVRIHLKAALDKLVDRRSPDYRNSIKESISAVEGAANAAAGTSSATLGFALNTMGLSLHPALDGAFKKLYGYTSDAEGIRHALMEEPDLHVEDAKFMLVACSAFVNYLRAKAARADGSG